ncbi:MAG TPA: trigger factor [Candidatus Fournierella merdipullorum]|uniref:Trigger factor n=1 Tax=Candidatus Allofournierella merdipullorum TaxID=2838595 RepID=A0A9D2E2W0_9FIRM|nr:trigger factor [Candidatus Fournierella merdipullorum]
MNLVKSEKLEKSMHELQFSVDAESFKAAIDKAYKREGKKYTVPGFRKGHAPRAVIEKMYGADIFHYDAINDLFPEAYEAAVVESGIQPVGRPEVDVVSESLEDGVVLKVVVAVKPEIKVGNYTGLKATKKVNTVDDADVEAELVRMQNRNGRIVTREGKAENGDTVDMDFEGFVDGVAFEGGKAEHYSLVLGSGSFIPGFEDQLIGHEAGEEFDVNVTFPEEYQAKELAGKPAVFKIKLHEVKTKELPALDDEFAKDVSEYDTLDELKASIRKGMEEQNEKQAALAVENDLVDQVIATIEGDIPDAMYEARMDEAVRDFEYRLAQQGLKLDMYLQYMGQTLESFRASFKEQAEKQVKIRLALEAVAAAEQIVASDEDLENELQRIADSYKMELAKVKELVNADEVKKDLAVNKAIDFIRDHAEITEEKVAKEG